MGKASILVVPVTIIALALIVYAISRLIIRSTQVPKNVRQNAALADEAMSVFKILMTVDSLDPEEINVLSSRSKKAIMNWTEKYRKVNR